MNATDTAAGLRGRAEEICRRYLPMDGDKAGIGLRATSTARGGARCSSASPDRAFPASGPTPRQVSTATCSTSSGIAAARPRCARRSWRRAPSCPCRSRRRRARTTMHAKRPAASGGAAAPSTAPTQRRTSAPAGLRREEPEPGRSGARSRGGREPSGLPAVSWNEPPPGGSSTSGDRHARSRPRHSHHPAGPAGARVRQRPPDLCRPDRPR